MSVGNNPTTSPETPTAQPGSSPTPGQGGNSENQAPEFMRMLSAEYQSHPSIKSYKSLDDFAKSYLSAQSMIGKDKLVLPTNEEDTETWNQVWSKLGRPEKPNEYGFARPEELPQDIPWDNEEMNMFADLMHKAGLSKKQAGTIFEAYKQNIVKQYQDFQSAQEKSLEEASSALKKEWGEAYNQNINIANRVVKLAGDEFNQAVKDKKWGNDPVFIKAMAKLGPAVLEDVAKGIGSGTMVKSPESALQEIATLEASPEYKAATKDRSHPNYNIMVSKRDSLYKQAYPDQN